MIHLKGGNSKLRGCDIFRQPDLKVLFFTTGVAGFYLDLPALAVVANWKVEFFGLILNQKEL